MGLSGGEFSWRKASGKNKNHLVVRMKVYGVYLLPGNGRKICNQKYNMVSWVRIFYQPAREAVSRSFYQFLIGTCVVA